MSTRRPAAFSRKVLGTSKYGTSDAGSLRPPRRRSDVVAGDDEGLAVLDQDVDPAEQRVDRYRRRQQIVDARVDRRLHAVHIRVPSDGDNGNKRIEANRAVANLRDKIAGAAIRHIEIEDDQIRYCLVGHVPQDDQLADILDAPKTFSDEGRPQRSPVIMFRVAQDQSDMFEHFLHYGHLECPTSAPADPKTL